MEWFANCCYVTNRDSLKCLYFTSELDVKISQLTGFNDELNCMISFLNKDDQ